MISGRIEDKLFWATCPPAIQQMLEVLDSPDMANKEEGRHEINDDMFYVLSHYHTRPLAQVLPETHRKYIDVQFVRLGREAMLWSPLPLVRNSIKEYGEQMNTPYKPEKDVQYYNLHHYYSVLPCPTGSVNIFFPNDIHVPGVHFEMGDGSPEPVQKIVGKVAAHLVLVENT